MHRMGNFKIKGMSQNLEMFTNFVNCFPYLKNSNFE
jgi:hypothetical protein